MYQQFINFIGIDPMSDMFGFIACCMITIFMLDKVFVFLYSIFQR